MSFAFVLSLAGLAMLLLVLRLTLPMLPIFGLARRVAPVDLALTLLGVLGLVRLS
ncbi:hypothetical protein [Arthrobacter sp. H5]|uniref:hypothetical protein n=1 Tax=Arthrobacter sp. H5 TaxID=1267973 RepID=UPI0004B6C5A8|nr:hypothetical protein [Arthrobacter sp. H5]